MRRMSDAELLSAYVDQSNRLRQATALLSVLLAVLNQGMTQSDSDTIEISFPREWEYIKGVASFFREGLRDGN